MDSIEIHIEPSQKRGASFGAPRCLWEIRITSESHGTESLFVPKAVAKEAEGMAGRASASTRREVLEEIGRIQTDEAWKKVVACLQRRDYSVKELTDKLIATGFSPEASRKAIAKARDLRILDDLRFADQFICAKKLSGWGRQRIAGELDRRGIPADSLPGWPDEYFDDDEECQRAWQLIACKSVPERNGFQKLVSFLVRRGYSYQVAKDCAARRLEEQR